MARKEEKVKKEIHKMTFDLCKMKYEEEKYREKTINTKAGFLLTVLSILISIMLGLLTFCYEIDFKDKILISWFIYIIIILLISSLILTILSQCIKNVDNLSKIDEFISVLESNNKEDVFAPLGSAIHMYKEVIENRHKKNEDNAILLLVSFIVLLISLLLIIIFSVIILVRL